MVEPSGLWSEHQGTNSSNLVVASIDSTLFVSLMRAYLLLLLSREVIYRRVAARDDCFWRLTGGGWSGGDC